MEAPKIPGLFKTRGPKQFHFQARYYDERKERMLKRREQLKRELAAEAKLSNEDKAEYQSMIKGSMRSRSYRQASAKSNRRLMIILAGLILICFWLWNQMGGLL